MHEVYLRVPEKRTGSWGMMVNFFLRSCKANLAMFSPSIIILPSAGSTNLNKNINLGLFKLITLSLIC